MAVTLLVVAVVQVLIPGMARPHLRTPVTETVRYNEAVSERHGELNIRRDEPALVIGYAIPGALMLTSEAELLTESGEKVYRSHIQDCLTAADQAPATATGGADNLEKCLAGHNLHFEVSSQPAARYWSFQWVELGGFLIVAVLLSGLAFWRIRHVRG
jgi:hypothetical protein